MNAKEIVSVVEQVCAHVAGMPELGRRRRYLITDALHEAAGLVEENELVRETIVELRAREGALLEALAEYRKQHGPGCCACCQASAAALKRVERWRYER